MVQIIGFILSQIEKISYTSIIMLEVIKMDEFKVDEVLIIKPISEDSPSKREFLKKKKKKQPEEEKKPNNIEENNQEKHIDIYV